MKHKPIVGLCGYAQSGKSTAAQRLASIGFRRFPFAGPLKSMMRELGLSHAHTDGKLKEVPLDMLGWKTPRYAMQTLGTEWGRNIIHPDLWINAWRCGVKDCVDEGFPVVAEDVRFPNEVKAVTDLGGIIIKIDRPGGPSIESGSHASERSLDALKPSVVIVNDGSVEQFHAAIDEVIALLFVEGGNA